MIVVPGGAAYGSSSCAEDTGGFAAEDEAAVPLDEADASAVPVVPPLTVESLAGPDSLGPGGGTITVSEVSTFDLVPARDPAAVELEPVVDEPLESAAVPEPAVAADAAEDAAEDAEGLATAEPLDDGAVAAADAVVSAALAAAQ